MNKIGTVDPLSLLERKDKWFLGGGKGALYAPPFPRWLESPGFWDESYFADIRLTRLFTVLFCDFAGKPVRLRGEMVSWRPDRMIFEHLSDSHKVRETRLVTEDQEWVSVFELLSGEALMAFVWSLPELKEPGYGTPWQSLLSCEVWEDGISYEFATAWPSELEPDRTGIDAERISNRGTEESKNRGMPGMLPSLSLHIALTANQPRLSHTVNLAQRHDDAPLWQTSLLPQKLRDGKLPGDSKLFVGPPPLEGLVHILQQYELQAGEPLVVSCQVSSGSPSNPAGRRGSQGNDIVAANEQAWRTYFASVPQFNSSDPYLTHAYWYRWYGLRLNTVDVSGMGSLPMRPTTCQVVEEACSREDGSGDEWAKQAADQDQAGPGTHGQAAHATTFSPFITEGIGFFRNFVTYSAQAHLREVAWMHSPQLAIGILENLAKCQRPDGSFPGHNYSCRPARDFYHADFATGTKTLSKLHPGGFNDDSLQMLVRYALYLIQERGLWVKDEPEGHPWLRMTAVLDQNETGQEYMSRYQAVSEYADQWSSFRVGGTDATTYTALLLDFITEEITDGSFLGKDGWGWCDEAERPVFALLYASSDHEAAFFCDVLEDSSRSSARPAAGFYPLLLLPGIIRWQMQHETIRERFVCEVVDRWLLSPNEFWLPKGFPATALSDPTFSADSEWKDKRLNCPWNGRSWPMVNSHLVDAIANVAREAPSSFSAASGAANREQGSRENEEGIGGGESANSDLRAKAAEALMKAITLMFHDGDPSRPNSYEHYDPFTGTPSLYRGYDDYMHSWIVDLIMRHAVGVEPGEDHIDPLPLGVDWIECTDIPHPRGRMHVRIEKDRVVECSIH